MTNNKTRISRIALDVMKRNMHITLLLIVSMIASIIFGLIPPLVLGKAVDALAAGSGVTLSMGIFYALFLTVAGLADAFCEAMITVMGQKMTHALRTRMSQKLMRLPARRFIETDPGETTSIMVNDVDTLEALFDEGIASMIVDLGNVIATIAVIMVRSTGLGVLMLIVTPLLFLYTRHVQKEMLSAQLDRRAAIGRANAAIPETVHTIRMVHVFRRESWMEERYKSTVDQGFRAMEKNNFFDAIYSPVIITVSSVVIGIMMTLSGRGGIWMKLFGMTVGTTVANINYVGKVFTPLENIGKEIQNILSAIAGVHRIRDFLSLPERSMGEDSAIADDERDTTCAIPVELSHVDFGYDSGSLVLRNFSLRLRRGEHVTLAGRTGAGKTTIFRLILGLYTPLSGSVCIFGKPADKISDRERRHIFGYVEQNFHAVPGSVRDQITLLDKEVTEEDVARALVTVGLKDVVRHLPEGLDTPYEKAEFSQGQTQLLSIARAIAKSPSILLLDEITASLDSATEEKTMAALTRAMEGRTVLSISHRLYERMPASRLVEL